MVNQAFQKAHLEWDKLKTHAMTSVTGWLLCDIKHLHDSMSSSSIILTKGCVVGEYLLMGIPFSSQRNFKKEKKTLL